MPSATARTLSHSLLIPLLLLSSASAAIAHGVNIEQRNSVEIEARYDDGKPMAHAQVAVFPPDEPALPLLTGTTDAEGRFQFVPDAQRAGAWSVQVRLAGHGAIATVPVGANEGTAGASSTSAGFTPLQTLGMAIAVVWGCIGTAFFFSRRSVAAASPSLSPSLTSDSHAHS